MGDLTGRQRALLGEWLGGWDTVADHSWPLQDTAQSLGTVVWAHQIGDADFTEHGRTMIERFADNAALA
jgi:hypothetical protein